MLLYPLQMRQEQQINQVIVIESLKRIEIILVVDDKLNLISNSFLIKKE